MANVLMQILIFLLTVTLTTQAMDVTVTEDDVEQALAGPLIKFSSSIFRSAERDRKNVVISPMSIHMALNLLLLGAKPASETEAELISTLGYAKSSEEIEEAHKSYAKLAKKFKAITDKGLEEMKTRPTDGVISFQRDDRTPVIDLWSMAITKNIELLSDYSTKLQSYYNGSIQSVRDDDDTNKEMILSRVNKWAKDAGYGSEILKSGDLNTYFRILLISAVRVQAFWARGFQEISCKDNCFYNFGLVDQAIKKGKMLHVADVDGKFIEFTETPQYKYHNSLIEKATGFESLKSLKFRVLEIPMKGNVSYTIFEPLSNGTGRELSSLVDGLLADSGAKLAKALDLLNHPAAVADIDHLVMPPFGFESDINLIDLLKSIGLKKIFDKERSELNQMAVETMFVDKAKHMAVIDVNKDGLKAAGVTIIRIVPLSAVFKKEPIRIQIKNPYMFIVRFGRLPLFIGQVNKI